MTRRRICLGVNVDHVATLRQARGTSYPSPIDAAQEAIRAGAGQITVHLREDRRHIQPQDVWALKRTIKVPLNLEMAPTREMLAFALKVQPHTVTIVPERRQELTTEGGFDLVAHARRIRPMTEALNDRGIRVSAFIEPDVKQSQCARTLGFDAVEFHTGAFCDHYDTQKPWKRLLREIATASTVACDEGLLVFAGHGLNLNNIAPLFEIAEIQEYNIGHSIVADAVLRGFYAAVRAMVRRLHA